MVHDGKEKDSTRSVPMEWVQPKQFLAHRPLLPPEGAHLASPQAAAPQKGGQPMKNNEDEPTCLAGRPECKHGSLPGCLLRLLIRKKPTIAAYIPISVFSFTLWQINLKTSLRWQCEHDIYINDIHQWWDGNVNMTYTSTCDDIIDMNKKQLNNLVRIMRTITLALTI